MRSPYTEHAASGLPNPTPSELEIRFVQAQDQQVVLTSVTMTPSLDVYFADMKSKLTKIYYTSSKHFRFLDLPNTHIHVITNRRSSAGSVNSSLLLKEVVRFGIIVDVWVIDECKKTGKESSDNEWITRTLLA